METQKQDMLPIIFDQDMKQEVLSLLLAILVIPEVLHKMYQVALEPVIQTIVLTITL